MGQFPLEQNHVKKQSCYIIQADETRNSFEPGKIPLYRELCRYQSRTASLIMLSIRNWFSMSGWSVTIRRPLVSKTSTLPTELHPVCFLYTHSMPIRKECQVFYWVNFLRLPALLTELLPHQRCTSSVSKTVGWPVPFLI